MAEVKEIGERDPLNRTQATWVAAWLKDSGTNVRGGWTGVYQMTPTQVARKYHVELAAAIAAAKGEKR